MNDGDDQLLAPYLTRIAKAMESVDPDATASRAATARALRSLRLEPWEVGAYRKVTGARPAAARDHAAMLQLYVDAAALRLRIDEEATALAALPADAPPAELMERVDRTLSRARELDATFSEYLSEGEFRPDARELDQLFRSRFRLLRGFSGLWLLFDERRRRQQ